MRRSKIYTRADGRKYVVVYRGERRETTLYSRYLMERHLGRRLEEHEHVDHINDDPTDDRIENLQIISQLENTLKYHALHPKEIWTVTCAECQKEFQKPADECRKHRKSGKPGPFCGKSCAGRANRRKANEHATDSGVPDVRALEAVPDPSDPEGGS